MSDKPTRRLVNPLKKGSMRRTGGMSGLKWIRGYLAKSSRRAIRVSNRAKAAPRQMWMPVPKDK